MTDPPAPTGGYEVVIARGRGRVWAARVRAAGHGSRVRLVRLRRWLATPQGRRASVRVGQGLAAGVLLIAGGTALRRLLSSARDGFAGVAGAARRVAAAAGAVGEAVRATLSLRWLSRLLGALAGPARSGAHTHCVECHARIRTDARVCFRCRAVQPAGVRTPRRRALRWGWRVATGSLYHRCPDCRRPVHADARRCHRCGAELGRGRRQRARRRED